ncbi:hypothetical protein Adeg_0613 [Ammonifex degensii KC4]|uniref:DUF4350 domain-containing protein n=1 Tax=Ammonifex degensii (strain DSM 10501 / KC4) TaxID=429009 RepID=C9RBY4_AMMDK|nr:DUF4350 domain-containing protein [Ammonifex degensii]ACX51761.1 hypothetical protein Adeg_0613 [Ammonifex degensii KC4]
MRVAWSSTHQEFLLSDGYYFSGLAREAHKRGIVIEEIDDFAALFAREVIVFNYPEKPFTPEERARIEWAVKNEGKRVVFTAHFRNKDGVAAICSKVTEPFGIKILPEGVRDEVHSLDEDPFILVTEAVEAYNEKVKKVVFPYPAPLEVGPEVRVILRGMDTAHTDTGVPAPILVAERTFPGGGSLVVCGSCIFWDNYSLFRLDNLPFALSILQGREVGA